MEQAKSEEDEGKERIVVLRPEWMTVKTKGKLGKEQEIRQPVNIINLRNLFKKPGGNTFNNNPFGDGPVFWNNTWYNGQDFAKEQLKPGYTLPTKEVIPESENKTWDQQSELLGEDEKRREANEVVWDTLLVYATKGEKLLVQKADWTNSQTSYGLRAVVFWYSDGLGVYYWGPADQDQTLGVCSSKVV